MKRFSISWLELGDLIVAFQLKNGAGLTLSKQVELILEKELEAVGFNKRKPIVRIDDEYNSLIEFFQED